MKRLLMLGLTSMLVAGAPVLAADTAEPEDVAAKLAGILVEMNHFPADEEKETLSGIAANDAVDDDLQTIASAIAGIEHRPSAMAQTELNGILHDDSASAEEKTLAAAVLRFEHKVSAEDRSALEELASP